MAKITDFDGNTILTTTGLESFLFVVIHNGGTVSIFKDERPIDPTVDLIGVHQLDIEKLPDPITTVKLDEDQKVAMVKLGFHVDEIVVPDVPQEETSGE
jgi:hypothetical protein